MNRGFFLRFYESENAFLDLESGLLLVLHIMQ